MNPNTMTLDEVRDELARMDGWVYRPACKLHPRGRWWRFIIDAIDGEKEWRTTHPYPRTRDGAARALPKGRDFTVEADERYVRCYSYPTLIRAPDRLVSAYHVTCEITARFRLALACRLAEVKQ